MRCRGMIRMGILSAAAGFLLGGCAGQNPTGAEWVEIMDI